MVLVGFGRSGSKDSPTLLGADDVALQSYSSTVVRESTRAAVYIGGRPKMAQSTMAQWSSSPGKEARLVRAAGAAPAPAPAAAPEAQRKHRQQQQRYNQRQLYRFHRGSHERK